MENNSNLDSFLFVQLEEHLAKLENAKRFFHRIARAYPNHRTHCKYIEASLDFMIRSYRRSKDSLSKAPETDDNATK